MPDTEDHEFVQYQFEIDSQLWSDWKDTIPRSKSLREHIIELIEEDANRRQTIGSKTED